MSSHGNLFDVLNPCQKVFLSFFIISPSLTNAMPSTFSKLEKPFKASIKSARPNSPSDTTA